VSRLILAVDTTGEFGSLALLRGEQLVEEVTMHAPGGFSPVLYGHLAALFERQALRPDAIDCFAAASGPGSFTGVRVGLACVKGLAEARGRPAVGVSNLQALAWFGEAPRRAAVLDARRGEVYGAVYDAGGRLVAPEVVAPFARWIETLPAGELEFVCSGFTPPLAGTRFERAKVRTAPRALAVAVARLASRAEPCDPAALDANYVRRSDAELLWKDCL
jgi:tRNA threonylcarbamoyladenosine biosynthesis protein TsaB